MNRTISNQIGQFRFSGICSLCVWKIRWWFFFSVLKTNRFACNTETNFWASTKGGIVVIKNTTNDVESKASLFLLRCVCVWRSFIRVSWASDFGKLHSPLPKKTWQIQKIWSKWIKYERTQPMKFNRIKIRIQSSTHLTDILEPDTFSMWMFVCVSFTYYTAVLG